MKRCRWEYTETEIWRVGEDRISLYHVFGLLTTKRQTVLAFCEAREGSGGDAGGIRVQKRRRHRGKHDNEQPRRAKSRAEDDLREVGLARKDRRGQGRDDQQKKRG